MRIAILGNSGAGKSTLARWLVTRSGAPSLDLDTVAWEPNQVAMPRSPQAAEADVRSFCATHSSWVIEGCYTNLIRVCLAFQPRLLFVNPGVERCLANCSNRPWEPHKFASKTAQDAHLEFLLSWVRDYYTRTGGMSLHEHAKCFNEYDGPREELTELPCLDPPSPAAAAWLLR